MEDGKKGIADKAVRIPLCADPFDVGSSGIKAEKSRFVEDSAAGNPAKNNGTGKTKYLIL